MSLRKYFPWWPSELTQPRQNTGFFVTTKLPVSDYEAMTKDFHRLNPGPEYAATIMPSGVSYAGTTGSPGVSYPVPSDNRPQGVDQIINPSGVGGVAPSLPTADKILSALNIVEPGN